MRHMFICPRCGEPTRELFELHCLSCSEIIKESEDGEGKGLFHRTGEVASPVIGHPGSW